jgi:acetoin utilization deacetylase AcuC-like enzyme
MTQQEGSRALLVDDPRFMKHASPAYHPERPERMLAARSALSAVDVQWERVAARAATDDELGRVHSAAFVDSLEKLRGREMHLDPDTYVGPESIETARLAAGSAVEMVDRLFAPADSAPRRGVALLRPPGHHARREQAMGFCLLNNVAIAAAHARAHHAERVLVVDWDVHHGNGTEEMFWRDPSVVYASLHQYPFYPGTGALRDVGDGDGRGFTVNVPLSAGGTAAIYRGAFERVILPVVHSYRPDLLLISAGFDASARDPLAEMELDAPAFGWMARSLAVAMDEVAGGANRGKVGLVLEGGYDLVALEAGLASAIRGLVVGEADDIPRDVDDVEVCRAARMTEKLWKL